MGRLELLARGRDRHVDGDVRLRVAARVFDRDRECGVAAAGDVVDGRFRFEFGAARADADERAAVGARGDLSALGARRLPADARLHGRRFQPAEVGQRVGARGGDPMHARRGELFLDQGRHPLRVDHVGGEEDLHVARDQRDRLFTLPAEGGGRERCDLRDAFGAQVEHELEVALRRRHLRGHAQILGAIADFLGLHAQLVDLQLDVQRGLRARSAEGAEQRPGDLRVGFAHEFVHRAVVVLEFLLLVTAQTAGHEHDDQDQQHHADPRGPAPAHHHRVVIGGAARRGGSAGPGTLRGHRAALSGRSG